MDAPNLQVDDWEAAHQAAALHYFPHDLRPLGARRPDFRLAAVDLGPLLIGRIGWGADVSIDCEYPGATEVNVPLSGVLQSRRGSGAIESGRGTGTVFTAGEAHPITRWSHDCEAIGVKFSQTWLEDHARRGFGVSGALALPGQLDLRDSSMGEWFRLVRSLHLAGVSDPRVTSTLASAVTTAFLAAVLPEEDASGSEPRSLVQRVVDALGDDPAREWTSVDMAEVAGVSVRRMQERFAEEMGRSPRQVLAELRLDRARASLRAGATVSEAAATWGFTNPGRFASAYRKRFGLLPSAETR